jgi:predicted  nucleic acid-binding Zn-ribbon protein
MKEVIGQLLRLQERDNRIRLLEQERAQVPKEKAAREVQRKTLEETLEKARQRSKEIEVEKKALEVEVAAQQTRIARYRTQQMETRKNEEYSALAHEIEAAQKQITALEDRELLLMEEGESLAPALVEAETAHRIGCEKLAEQLASLDKKLANIDRQLEELRGTREALLDGLDEDVLSLYERLFASKGGTALVPLEHEVCTGCHMKVPAQTVVDVQAARALVHCPHCGRILYFPH